MNNNFIIKSIKFIFQVNIVIFIIIFLFDSDTLLQIVLNITIPIIIFNYINIYIHEFGHACAGMLVSFSINRIIIGTGKEIFRKDLGKFLLIITNNFNGGLTYLGDVSEKYLKLRYLVFILGGVGAQVLAISLVMLIFTISIDDVINFADSSLLYIFIYSNLFMILVNIVPYYTNIGGIKYPSDGLQIIRTPFFNEGDIQTILATSKIIEGHELYEEKKYLAAENIFRKCASSFPKSISPKLNISCSLLKQGKLVEAQLVLEEIIKTNNKNPYDFLIYNNLAYIYILQSDRQLLEKAEYFSNKAFKLNPNNINVLGVRGCILIEKEQITEGLKLLKPYINLNQPIGDKKNTPGSFIYTAYGLYLKGDIDLSLKYIAKVERDVESLDLDYQKLFDQIIIKTNNFGRQY